MFLKTHNSQGITRLVNLDNVACIIDGRIVYKDDSDYKPVETLADIIEALKTANQLIEIDDK